MFFVWIFDESRILAGRCSLHKFLKAISTLDPRVLNGSLVEYDAYSNPFFVTYASFPKTESNMKRKRNNFLKEERD